MNLWEPGKKKSAPFCSSTSSSGIQMEQALGLEKGQKGLSTCSVVGFAQGSLTSAWSCHIRMPSTPSSTAATRPISWPYLSQRSLTRWFVAQRLMRCTNTFS